MGECSWFYYKNTKKLPRRVRTSVKIDYSLYHVSLSKRLHVIPLPLDG